LKIGIRDILGGPDFQYVLKIVKIKIADPI